MRVHIEFVDGSDLRLIDDMGRDVTSLTEEISVAIKENGGFVEFYPTGRLAYTINLRHVKHVTIQEMED